MNTKKPVRAAIAGILLAIGASSALAAPAVHESESRAEAIGRLAQTWQARINAAGLQVEDAKNWSRRNLAKLSRLEGERLAIAQRASTLPELELAMLEAPVPTGTHLDVLMAMKPTDITMAGTSAITKSSPATSPAAYSNLVFTAVNSCRILDSRTSQGGTGSWNANSVNNVKIGPYPGGYFAGVGAQGGSTTSCGLDTLAGPGQIAVIMAAVSTVSQVGAGYLTFFPQGSPNPGLSSVSQWYQPGYIQTSFVLIPTNLSGTVAASGFTSAKTDVIIDVVGYFLVSGVTVNNNITLPQSTATVGNIYKQNGNSFIHNFGSLNTFVGESSGNFTMTGTGSNTSIGAQSFQTNTSGAQNTASGWAALFNNTTGAGNTAAGAAAMFFNDTGAQNTASGVNALQANISGNLNVGIGASALAKITTGSGNIGVGPSAGFNLTTGILNIDIGNVGVAGEGSTIRIGAVGDQTRTFVAGIRGITTGASDAIAVVIDSNGQLGTISSSRRFKEDIADMDKASAALMKLRPVTFHYKNDGSAKNDRLQYGLIAEEVAPLYPDLVARTPDGQAETVMYQYLPPMLLNEYQKQQRTLEAQAKEIARLNAALDRINDKLGIH